MRSLFYSNCHILTQLHQTRASAFRPCMVTLCVLLFQFRLEIEYNISCGHVESGRVAHSVILAITITYTVGGR